MVDFGVPSGLMPSDLLCAPHRSSMSKGGHSMIVSRYRRPCTGTGLA